MSTELIGIGARMRKVRLDLGYSQSKMAAILDIADRTYKYYEVEKREIPLSIAVRFCRSFDIELNWFVSGDGPQQHLNDADLMIAAVEATLSELGNRANGLPAALVARHVRYVYDQSASMGENPVDVARNLVTLLPD